jgi:Flagellar assembly protein T, C-terminal domain
MMQGSLARWLLGACVVALLSSGCATIRNITGYGSAGDPSVTILPTEPRWLLISNPRFGDVASEPEYIWVEEEKVPTTLKTLILGKKSLIASPEIVAKYGSPPGGGRVSPRQGGPYKLESFAPPSSAPRGPVAAVPGATRTDGGGVPSPPRGYVVFVDTSRVVIDLTAKDGVKPGSAVSVRRDKIPIVHPITGELLGELDEEVATGKVSEVRDKFSVVEIENVPAGAQIKVKDRVVVR